MTREPAGRLAIDQSLHTELRGATVQSIGHSHLHSHRRTRIIHTHMPSCGKVRGLILINICQLSCGSWQNPLSPSVRAAELMGQSGLSLMGVTSAGLVNEMQV